MCPMNCHPTLCGMRATIDGDTVLDVRGDPENPDSAGFLCVRGHAAREIVGNPKRLLYPMIRDDRSTQHWRRASWDEALDRIVAAAEAVGAHAVGVWRGHGALANDFGVFANASLMQRLSDLAGFQCFDAAMICWGLGAFGLGLTGVLEANTKEDMGANADLILLWGANLASQPNTTRHLTAAQRRGAVAIAIDVRTSEACRKADEAVLLRPGTDAALALAMMHVILDEGRHDDDFVGSHTLGFEELRAHVKDLSPAWASEITGVPAERIVTLARRYAETDRAMIIMGGSSLFKDQHGWQSSRAIACLPALTGKLGREGCGLGPRHMGLAHGFGMGNIRLPKTCPPERRVPNHMTAILDAVNDGRIRVMMVSGGNMASSFADTARLGSGFAELELVVTHDLFMHETARRYADIVLPATSWLEDIGCKATATHLYLMDRHMEPPGETRSVARLARDLAVRLGLDGFYPWPDEVGHIDAVLDHPSTGHATVASLRACRGIAPLRVSHVGHLDFRFSTPSGKVEFRSDRAAECGLPALPTYQPRPNADGPLELRVGRTLTHFHSFYDSGRALPSLARLEAGPLLLISPADAAARGIVDGREVRLHNPRGELDAVARVTEDMPEGTVWMHDGWPGLNALTSGEPCLPETALELFPFSAGQAAFDAHVDVSAMPIADRR